MNYNVLSGIIIPFVGTSAGAACVFLMKNELRDHVQRGLTGFAAGVMVAASIWSLLIPAMEQTETMGTLSFVPAVAGFWIGILLLLFLDHMIPHLHMHAEKAEGPASNLTRTTMMVLAVTLHNIPEGMAVGVVYAGLLTEGAIISMPLHAEGKSRGKACLSGIMSGAVEPAAALLMILAAEALLPLMPYMLSAAAGAMLYVVVEELIPEMSEGEHSNIGVLMFAVGFTLMMALDVALG